MAICIKPQNGRFANVCVLVSPKMRPLQSTYQLEVKVNELQLWIKVDIKVNNSIETLVYDHTYQMIMYKRKKKELQQ